MKRIAIIGALMCVALKSEGAYFSFVGKDPGFQVTGGATFNSKFSSNGGISMLSLVYHKADVEYTLIPQSLLDLGIKPISWSALNLGVGGANGSFVVPLGPSINLTPSVLGPLTQALEHSGNPYLNGLGNFIDGPRGGISFGPIWAAHPMIEGTIQPFNKWRFVPGWFAGGMWKF